ncbi:glycoside hydrolase family 2 TIM barrel-domain containing protein [Pedobacter punctiformis]|uniref:Malectin domain-containing carbohydrate-binding protein n=1 Tax=Pedobacter punctiformis TaxID=3004097 RepID=A0ABT4L7U4_9SPHI|nr:glycoside hydrolase family 2 TIM barrel-domain containing protein [Pedobacter sp. HCMS5-2]MCZ4243988.1 malectin domain-containing carbohydrate-binding protein [Pedobacter sp. HCMS5-2]
MSGKEEKHLPLMKFILWTFLTTIWSVSSFAQDTGRKLISLNDQWEFHKENGTTEKVNLPHTWNDKDVLDDEPGYYRGLGIYKRKLVLDESAKGKDIYLVFNGVAQEAEVLVNGKSAAKHIGSYTRFIVPITSFLNYKEDIIEVRANNRFNEDILPLTADFTFFGGIYRHVSLLITNSVHFSQKENGSAGVFITTPQVSSATAKVQVKSTIENTSGTAKKVQIQTILFNAQGKEISSQISALNMLSGGNSTLVQDLNNIKQPELWSPENPYLYRVVTKIIDPKTKLVLDQVSNPLGFRWFKFDANEGFFLNDKPLKLIGASRHQDYENLGNATPDALQIRDIELLKQMGGNFLRVAHYPQDPMILEACDRLGILASVEIPVVNTITESEAFTANCLNMQVEMIKQNFNHPSIIIWAYMNEVLLRTKFANDKPRQQIYFDHVRELAQKLDDLTRKEDPSRYTLLVNHGAWDIYNKVGLTKIPMIVGWNLYSGWYSGTPADFGKFLDRHHKELADKPMLVTEYGADADPRIRSFSPVRFDKSVEYGIYFNQIYLNEMLKRPFVSGGMAWNLADFNSETREETMPHINNKGLLTIGRVPKDTYFLYKAYLLDKPYLKITSAQWKDRTGVADSASLFSTQPLQVATNLKSAELFLNGKSLGAKEAVDHICSWQVPFADGLNQLRVVSATHSDQEDINFQLQPYRFTDGLSFKSMNVLLGSKRFYMDEKEHQLWMPDQPYRKGSWGWIGGEPYKGTNNRITYGSDKNILETDNDPIYQTQQVGIQQFKMDVPDGEYELSLYFAELVGGISKESLAYNLDNTHKKEVEENRIFSVAINGSAFLTHTNLAKDFGYTTAIRKKTRLTVQNGKGITIDFTPIEGKPVLNALQLRKVY